MISVTGYSSITLDSHKRLAIPARYREILRQESENKLFVTLGFELDKKAPFLELYPLPAWKEMLEKIAQLPSLHKVTKGIQRKVLGHATELSIDANSRILVPQALRELASIEKDVILSGTGYKFELWNTASWNDLADVQRDTAVDFDSLPDAFKNF